MWKQVKTLLVRYGDPNHLKWLLILLSLIALLLGAGAPDGPGGGGGG